MRRAATLAIIAALTLPAAASAAPAKPAKPPKKVCNLVVDPAGDPTSVSGPRPLGPALEHDPDLDILSGDVASSRDAITAAIRPRSLRAVDPDAPTGTHYQAAFEFDGTAFVMTATYPIDGPGYYELYAVGSLPVDTGGAVTERVFLATVTGVRDLARKEVRISAPMRLLLGTKPALGKSRVTDLHLRSTLYTGPGRTADAASTVTRVNQYDVATVDSGRASVDYVHGTPSCVTAGR